MQILFPWHVHAYIFVDMHTILSDACSIAHHLIANERVHLTFCLSESIKSGTYTINGIENVI